MAVQKTQSPLALYRNPPTFFIKNLSFVVIVCDSWFVFLSPLCFCVCHSLPGAYSRETTRSFQELTRPRLRAPFRSLLARDYALLSGAYSPETTRSFQELTRPRLRAPFRSLLARDYALLSGAYSRETTRSFQELTRPRLRAPFRSLLARDYALLSGAYSPETTRSFQELTRARLRAPFRSLLARDYALLPVLMLCLSRRYVMHHTPLSGTRLLEKPEAGLNGL